jgi:catechol 2,3-dioxygenase-like lactoylglutathione lyase family enzyme
MSLIRGLHHSAYRCRNSAQTRRFYEDFLGLPLAVALEISESKTGRAVEVLHTFYRLGDGSFLAFFEAPGMPFEFKPQHDFDLHIALEVDELALQPMLSKRGSPDTKRAVSRIMASSARSICAIRTATSSSSLRRLQGKTTPWTRRRTTRGRCSIGGRRGRNLSSTTARRSVVDLLFPVGGATFWRQVENVPKRLERASVAWVLTRIGRLVEHL